jgi:hypothetical protein
MKGATLALILVGVAAAGGGVYFFVIRRKGSNPGKEESRALGAAQAILGAKAVQQGIPIPPGPPGQLQPWQSASAQPAGGGGGSGASSPYASQVFGAAGKIANLWYPGLGDKAAGIAKAIDSKIGLGLISKVPGLKKLKFW